MKAILKRNTKEDNKLEDSIIKKKELIERNGHVKMPIKAFDNRQLSIPKGQK